ncbi:MAG: acetyl-CoA carboxylase carboxyltransferase subunit beta [Chthonomonadales bacterium]|nr:acetyl-CoA carboxylase carboxyltransferase subunit beta [Chthonomonadales bacterium]
MRARPTMESVPDGFATKCASCGEILFARDLERNLRVCHRCGHHHRLPARERLHITVDEGSFVETDAELVADDPLGFPEYREKQERAVAATGLTEAVVTGTATIEGVPLAIGVADFGWIGGSMGSVVGEKVARALERGAARGLPVVMFTSSGGARMQEGLLALMQMAKTSAAVARLDRARVPYVTVLTDATTGGVYASYACLGDIILAEPGATVGFAGRRVGNQDVGARLPDNFQTSEFQWEHGMVDRVVPRKDMRATLGYLLTFFGGTYPNGR